MSEKQIVIALAGNPNAGKTSLFNKLTGLRAHVGNYPGVTVEQKWGECSHRGRAVKIVDLPGTYSLNSYSLDEKVARDFVINERPDVLINVVDATNLERNLYLTLQFLELGLPTVIALNMMDLAVARGITINIEKLGADLRVRALPVVATAGKGLAELLDAAIEVAEAPKAAWRPLEISYGQDIDEALIRVEELTRASSQPLENVPPRWLAIKYLEGDPVVNRLMAHDPALLTQLAPIRAKLTKHLLTTIDDELEGAMTDARYGFISGLRRVVVTRAKRDTRELSDMIDKVLLNRFFSPVFFIAVIYALYQLTFLVSGPVAGAVGALFETLAGAVSRTMADGHLKDLILEGLIGGVGGVMGFVPLIAFMFVGISILEDSGYMARVAFIVDRVFRAFGLHGNSVVAMIVGGGIAGGCAIPGIMATRTLRDPKERIATILVTPFMTCGAKLPVFLMLTGAFFQEHQALIMVGLTVFAWLVALVSAKILRVFVLPGASAPFVLELPPYRMPTVSGVLLHAWERTWSYFKRAGTVIVAITIVVWVMMTFPTLPQEQRAAEGAAMEAAALRYSVAGRLGGALEPASQLIGLDWRTNIALLGGLAAKEVVLSTLGTVYAMNQEEAAGDEESLISGMAARLAEDPAWSPLAAVSLMVFVLLYAPCFATVSIIRAEAGGKWALFSLVASTGWAYVLALAVFQGGKILGVG